MDEGKQIEDIIDARRRSGQYDALCNTIRYGNQGMNPRYVYSAYTTNHLDEIAKDDALRNYNMEGDNNNDFRYLDQNGPAVGPTDSEITLVRVKRENHLTKKKKNTCNNKSEIPDDLESMPGDGTHLGESPSLVNLVTLVVPSNLQDVVSGSACTDDEYLVPLSSWEPHLESEPDEGQPKASAHTRMAPALVDLNSPASDVASTGTVASVTKRKSTASVKDVFKCMIFWKRHKSDTNSDDEQDFEEQEQPPN